MVKAEGKQGPVMTVASFADATAASQVKWVTTTTPWSGYATAAEIQWKSFVCRQ